MSEIGMADQGLNPLSNNGKIWIGDDGDYTFTFTNDAGNGQGNVPITVVIWDFPPNDFEGKQNMKEVSMNSYRCRGSRVAAWVDEKEIYGFGGGGAKELGNLANILGPNYSFVHEQAPGPDHILAAGGR